MNKTQFIVQHTGRPYGAERIPDEAWKDLSTHASFKAAQQAEKDYVKDMHETIGQNTWDDHYRIVPDQDTTISLTFRCHGPVRARPNYCPEFRQETVTVPWPAREAAPLVAHPEGWGASWLCPDCTKREQEAEDAEIQRMLDRPSG